jgi:TetR/AcrR family transcriptional repressor of nem operon
MSVRNVKENFEETSMPRAKSYDPEAVVQDAMQLFWAEGFETTSIPKLEKHLGINRFSIYDSFESKRNLFVRALDAYTSMLIGDLVEPLETGTGGLSDLEEFVARFEHLFVDQKATRGCLICNTATEIGHRDEEIADRVDAYFARVEAAVFNCLLRARELGEVQGDKRALRDRARVARTCLQGVLMDLRLRQSKPETMRTINAVTSCIVGDN